MTIFTSLPSMGMRRSHVVWLVLLSCIVRGPAATAAEALHRLLRKHLSPAHQCAPIVRIADELTAIEADLRSAGSITIKDPDVWGESNLMLYLQEYDGLLARSVQTFGATMQAYVGRSDQAELQATAALGQGLSGATAPTATATPVTISPPSLYDTVKTAVAVVKPSSDGIALEPTEVERQRSTFIKVNQALRRKTLGDDNSRMAGYGLYLFRIPVSVLPGRETFEGHAAVITLRARLVVDANHLRDTFPKLVIADVVEDLAPLFQKRWADCPQAPRAKPLLPGEGIISRDARTTLLTIGTGTTQSVFELYGEENVYAILAQTKDHFGSELPGQLELRNFLTAYLTRAQLATEKSQLYVSHAQLIATAADAFVRGQCVDVANCREGWVSAAEQLIGAGCDGLSACNVMARASWCLAARAGLLSLNLTEAFGAIERSGPAPMPPLPAEGMIEFYNPAPSPETVMAWQYLIRSQFPIHVFTVDPDVEEQNIYDAFNRRRDLQLAVAYGVATGELNLNAALNFSRQIDLDMVSTGLNRTTVGFSHANDTFGWYFYPRVQSPPVERNNIAAFVRLLWSSGPTDRYDLKHRKLEPGVRECEVLIAMPSFVPRVQFDVTSNWERLTKPGCVARTYKEMLAQGERVQMLRSRLCRGCSERCFRPGDCDRLISRLDQLEAMLPLQTRFASIPYEFDLPGQELFDKGNVQFRPVLQGYYGLHYVSATQAADVFITGRYFHPTQTYVVAAGSVSMPVAVGAAPSIQPTDSSVTKGDGAPGASKAKGAAAARLAGGGQPIVRAASVVHRAQFEEPLPSPDGAAASSATLDGAAASRSATTEKGATADTGGVTADVRVLSRELILVRISKIHPELTKNPITVRVGTPAGVSNELMILIGGPPE